MKVIDVPFLNRTERDLQVLNTIMAAEPLHPVNISSWPEFNTTAKAGFSIAHLNDVILIRYEVEEEVFKSISRDFNQNVHLDNCVEFFIAFGSTTEAYYNIELNCLGAIKIGYGNGRRGRVSIDPAIIQKITIKTHMDYRPDTGIHSFKWQLLLSIPIVVFCYDPIDSLEGRVCRANFYKCGDELSKPHFLSWNRIHSATPDFHRSECFGQLNFEKRG